MEKMAGFLSEIQKAFQELIAAKYVVVDWNVQPGLIWLPKAMITADLGRGKSRSMEVYKWAKKWSEFPACRLRDKALVGLMALASRQEDEIRREDRERSDKRRYQRKEIAASLEGFARQRAEMIREMQSVNKGWWGNLESCFRSELKRIEKDPSYFAALKREVSEDMGVTGDTLYDGAHVGDGLKDEVVAPLFSPQEEVVRPEDVAQVAQSAIQAQKAAEVSRVPTPDEFAAEQPVSAAVATHGRMKAINTGIAADPPKDEELVDDQFDVTWGDFRASMQAFDLWLKKHRLIGLNTMTGENKVVLRFLQDLSQEPPVYEGGTYIKPHRKVPLAVKACMSEGVDPTKKANGQKVGNVVQYAIGCVKHRLASWASEKPAEKAAVAEDLPVGKWGS